jgi:predicted amidohydrolase
LDNGLFVVACNALRRGLNGSVQGGGMVAYGPDGQLLASCSSADERMLLVEIGGTLPRETPDTGMHGVSYFDRRRPELYM